VPPVTLKPFFQKHVEEQERRLAASRMTRQQQFEHGFIGVADLDDEELRAGRCRDESGNVPRTRGKTQPIPRDMYDEMVAEHERRFTHKLRENLDTMVDVMVEVATDDTVEPRDRLEAAKYIFERVAGKTPERVQIAVAKAPWEEVLHGIAKVTRAESHQLRQGVIDAEVVPTPPQEATEVQTEGDIGRPACVCGNPYSPNVVHRTDGPCYVPDGDNPQPVADSSSGPTRGPDPQAPEPDTGLPADQPTPDQAKYAAPTCPPITHGYSPVERAPSWDNPVNSSSTMRIDPAAANAQPRGPELVERANQAAYAQAAEAQDPLVSAYAAAQDLAERRLAAKRRIRDAKKRRIIARTMGVDGFAKAAADPDTGQKQTIVATEVPVNSAEEDPDTVQVQFGLAPPEDAF
jgi:hypothetical protein